MAEIFFVAVVAFIGTNLDDLLLNTLFYAEAQTPAARRGVVAGKYAGMALLLAVSLAGAFGLGFLPEAYVGWLGILPIGLGVLTLVRKDDEAPAVPDPARASSSSAVHTVFRVALVTVANGADNVGVYVPLFAGYTLRPILLTVGVFAVLVALWCRLGRALADLPPMRRGLERHRRVVIPTVYIALGVYVMLKNWLL